MTTRPHALRTTRGLLAALALPVALLAGCSDDSGEASGGDAGTEESGGSDAGTESGSEGESGDAGTTATTAIEAGSTMGSPITGDTAEMTIPQIAAGNPDTQTLTRLVVRAGLVSTLRDTQDITVFAPIDDAFAAVPADTLRTVVSDDATLSQVLTQHVVAGQLTEDQLRAMDGQSIETLSGAKLLVEVDGEGAVKVGGATIIIPDIPASNGTVHAVDAVIASPNG